MKHYCPMCGEQWDEDACKTCGWREGKQPRYTSSRERCQRLPVRGGVLYVCRGSYPVLRPRPRKEQ